MVCMKIMLGSAVICCCSVLQSCYNCRRCQGWLEEECDDDNEDEENSLDFQVEKEDDEDDDDDDVCDEITVL